MDWTEAQINDLTGFAQGDEYENEGEVRAYFTVDNLTAQGKNVGNLTEGELREMADTVIRNGWHCAPELASKVAAGGSAR